MSNTPKTKNKITLAPTPLAEGGRRRDTEDAERSRKEHMARLRALRLAKESADREAASSDAGKKPLRLPQAHRRQL